MKIFDYKFLILLGLTLVIYFIYREVEYIRSKLEKIERELKENKNIKQIENKETDKKNFNKNVKQIEMTGEVKTIENKEQIQSPKSNQKVINLGKTGLNLNPNLFNNNLGIKINESVNQINSVDYVNDKDKDSDTEESDEETTTIETDSSKHLAIYSNDNELFESTQNSLLESVEANKKEIIFQYDNKMEIPQIKTNIDDLMDSISLEEPQDANKPIINENNQMDNLIASDLSSKSNKSTKSEKEKSPSQKVLPLNEINQNTKPFDEKILNEKKLPEIKKIAESLRISLSKKLNGQVRLKNKNELIMEILAK